MFIHNQDQVQTQSAYLKNHQPQKQNLYSEFQLKERPEDQIIMTNLKISKCENQSHLQTPQKFANDCQSYHGNFDRRRTLFDFSGQLRYCEQICQNILEHQLLTNQCPDDCPFSHNYFEENYHPAKFRTSLCYQSNHFESSNTSIEDYQGSLQRQTCYKFHTELQIRLNASKYCNQIPSQKSQSPSSGPSNNQQSPIQAISLPQEQTINTVQETCQEQQPKNESSYLENNRNNQLNKNNNVYQNNSYTINHIHQIPSMSQQNPQSTIQNSSGSELPSQNAVGQSQQSNLSQINQVSFQQNQNQQLSQINPLIQSDKQYGVENIKKVQQQHPIQNQEPMIDQMQLIGQSQPYMSSYSNNQYMSANQPGSFNQTLGGSGQFQSSAMNQLYMGGSQINQNSTISSQINQFKMNHIQQYYSSQQNSQSQQYNLGSSVQNIAQPQSQSSLTSTQNQPTLIQNQQQYPNQNSSALNSSALNTQSQILESQPFIPKHKQSQSSVIDKSNLQTNQQQIQQQSYQNQSNSNLQIVSAPFNSQQKQIQQQSNTLSTTYQSHTSSLGSQTPIQSQQIQSQHQAFQNQSNVNITNQGQYQMNTVGQNINSQGGNQNFQSHFGALSYQNIDVSQPPKFGYTQHSNAYIKVQQNQIFEIYFQNQHECIRHLILNAFKTESCPISYQHNHKHCKFFHSIKDKRRVRDSVSPDLCDFAETEKCPKQDGCNLAHNKVERLYHVEKYKTKFCTKFPKQLANCDYGEYCSFAHSQTDLKTRIIHLMQKDADYYQFYFKTEWCPFNKEHNKAQCDYAHNWQDFRRKPHIFNYNAHELCQNWQAGTFIGKYEEGCILQAACLRSHGWKEQEYHPLYYKTRPCPEVKCGQIQQCPFHHNEQDRRIVTPDSSKQAMYPKLRVQSEQQIPISLKNMVLNNVNHLKEFLINNGLQNLTFDQLSNLLNSQNTPSVLLQYIDVKGVVSSERMRQLINQNEQHIIYVTQIQQNMSQVSMQSQPIHLQYQMNHNHQQFQQQQQQQNQQLQQTQVQFIPQQNYYHQQQLQQTQQHNYIISNPVPQTNSLHQVLQQQNQTFGLYQQPQQTQIDQQNFYPQNLQITTHSQQNFQESQDIEYQKSDEISILLPGFQENSNFNIIQDEIEKFNIEQVQQVIQEEEEASNKQQEDNEERQTKDLDQNEDQSQTQPPLQQQPTITVESFSSKDTTAQTQNRQKKMQFRKLNKGGSTENNAIQSSGLGTLIPKIQRHLSPTGHSKFHSNQQLNLTEDLLLQIQNLEVPLMNQLNTASTRSKQQDQQPFFQRMKARFQPQTFDGDMYENDNESSIFQEEVLTEDNNHNRTGKKSKLFKDESDNRGNRLADNDLSSDVEDDFEDEDDEAASDSLFQKVMRKINDANSSNGGRSGSNNAGGGGSGSAAGASLHADIEYFQRQTSHNQQQTEKLNINNLCDDSKGDSFSSGSLNRIKESGFNRQVTAQPVSYLNKLHQIEQEFLKVKSTNKSVRSIFSSSSKSKSKSRSVKGTKRLNAQEGGSGSNNQEGGNAGSELEKFSDNSGLSGSAHESLRSKKIVTKDVSITQANDDQFEDNQTLLSLPQIKSDSFLIPSSSGISAPQIFISKFSPEKDQQQDQQFFNPANKLQLKNNFQPKQQLDTILEINDSVLNPDTNTNTDFNYIDEFLLENQ